MWIIFVLKRFTATRFGLCIRSHHQADKVLNFFSTFISLMMAPYPWAETCRSKPFQHKRNCDWRLLFLHVYTFITTGCPTFFFFHKFLGFHGVEGRDCGIIVTCTIGCLYNLIWHNKYMSADCNVRIYKTNVRPVLTYASETRAETTELQRWR